MLNKTTFDFLRTLRENDSQAWMASHREEYRAARDDVIAFAGELITTVSAFDPVIARASLRPEKSVTRLVRDRRFGADRPPYKTDYYIVIGTQGIQGPAASYAVHVEPGNCFVGGGAPNPTGEELLRFRRRVSDDFSEFSGIVTSDRFTELFPHGITSQSGSWTKRIPRGFDADDPARDVLRGKGFITREPLADSDLTSDAGMARISRLLEGSKPLIDFLERSRG
ncbi:DUF2461 domain-containing protein [Rathayibacter sp. VKM Ac-2760]|uniref:DUF2461 domain-containing protein n=1 Tax=Rathayibacter sp. VKM Ac-2760 TaxID=2609253 RepID=UPI00131991EF|nr:DUF2461 domain-containing protein [Rathayibacter sp. VKM Ac-2760]QHC61059.1 TIGR02453 family protein [Rathayibacter sp. VKM Ac-2760]